MKYLNVIVAFIRFRLVVKTDHSYVYYAMYVCMYVCIYVCMYVCVYVCVCMYVSWWTH